MALKTTILPLDGRQRIDAEALNSKGSIALQFYVCNSKNNHRKFLNDDYKNLVFWPFSALFAKHDGYTKFSS
jgi:hypothetical protein